MVPDEITDLRALSGEVFRAVGPARIAALTLYATTADDLQDAKRATLPERSQERLLLAEEMLQSGLTDLLDRCGLVESAEMAAARRAACDSLDPLCRALRDGVPPTRDLLGDPEALRDVCLWNVDPALTDFLMVMLAFFDAAEARRQMERRKHALDTVRRASTIGRAIQMISVNASIEAGIVGAKGAGFKVIASEINSLADKTQHILAEMTAQIEQG